MVFDKSQLKVVTGVVSVRDNQTVNYFMDGGGVKYNVQVMEIRQCDNIDPPGEVGKANIYGRQLWVGLGPPRGDDPMVMEWYQLPEDMVEKMQ